jgi:choline dehydrogenase-like flavoprotein
MRAWRENFGCERVTEERFDAYFDRIWRTIGVTVNPVSVQRNNNLIFKEGAERLGLKGQFMARSAPGCIGCGICQYGCPTGGKFSIDRTFLAEAIHRGSVGVYADCRARGVQTEGDRVVAVTGVLVDPETHVGRGSLRVEADTFVLSGGPIGTPVFLLRNGLCDDTHCGQHLVVHPTSGLLAKFEQEIRPWNGVTQGYYVDCWERGFLLQTYSVTPDQYYLLLQTRAGRETMEYMADLAHIASAGALVHDEDSSGFVRSTPAGPDLYYHFGDSDKRRLIDGMRLCAEVFFAAGAQEVLAGHMGGRAIRGPQDVAQVAPYDIPAHHMFLYASHPMGTCRMGGDPSRSVVDPEGRVWGWANLRVADASVFPSSLGVNPQVTTMAMGLMVGESIAGS